MGHRITSARRRALDAGLVVDPPRPAGPDVLRNARECPHRSLIPEAEREGCGCSHRCNAGKSGQPNGGITVLQCWDCDLAPRRSWE